MANINLGCLARRPGDSIMVPEHSRRSARLGNEDPQGKSESSGVPAHTQVQGHYRRVWIVGLAYLDGRKALHHRVHERWSGIDRLRRFWAYGYSDGQRVNSGALQGWWRPH